MKIFAAITIVALSTTALALDLENTRAYDGDTILTQFKPVPELPRVSLRINGIDTPEIRGKCETEKKQAILARDTLNHEIQGKMIKVEPLKWDKYGGRIVANVTLPDGRDVSQMMLDLGLARPYNGGTKTSWCK